MRGSWSSWSHGSNNSSSSSSNGTGIGSMPASKQGNRAADDASVILDMQQASRLVPKDSAADMAAAGAAIAGHAPQLQAAKAPPGFSVQAEGAGKQKDLPQQQQITSIYDVFSRRRRGLILGVVCVSQFLNPFSSSIILPSLKVSDPMCYS